MSDCSVVEFFNHQVIANLPWNAIEILRVLKTYEIWVFLKKYVFRKKTSFFFNIVKGGKFAVECVSNDIISKKYLFFHLKSAFFFAEFRKILNYAKLLKFIEHFF